jgi:hypothetical protein
MGQCKCDTLPKLAVVDMGKDKAIFQTLDRVRDRGEHYWWLYACACRACGTMWVVASEERQNDIYIMKKLESPATELLLRDNVWPPDLERYEQLLEIGREWGRFVRFADPDDSPSLVYTIEDLARERPGIAVSRLAWLLNLTPELASTLARKVVDREGVDITFDG